MPDDPKIISLAGAVVNHALVTRLEELLAQARKGDVVNFAWAAARRDHVRLTGWTKFAGYGHDLGAAVLELSAGFGQMLMNGEEADPL